MKEEQIVSVETADGKVVRYVLLENQKDVTLVVLPLALRKEARAARKEGFDALLEILVHEAMVIDRTSGERLGRVPELRAMALSKYTLIQRAALFRTAMPAKSPEADETSFGAEVWVREKAMGKRGRNRKRDG